MTRLCLAVLLFSVVASSGCGDDTATDVGPSDGSLPDSSLPDSAPPEVGVPDSSEPDTARDIGTDAPPSMDSTVAADTAPDVTVDACADGGCGPAVCGDGRRTRGPAAEREGCDDGNLDDGDACSSACVPQPFVVYGGPSSRGELPALQGLAVAGDGTGALLIVWVSDSSSGRGRVLARRYTSTGVPIAPPATPIELDDVQAIISEPQVIGLAAGWVVVWSNNDLAPEQPDISFRIVNADGTMGSIQTANQDTVGPQTQPRATALTDGFVITWTNLLRTAEETGRGLMARVFRTTGTPRSDQFAVATDRTNDQHFSYLAAVGTRWIATWTHSAAVPGAVPVLYARRFDSDTPIDATQFEVSSMMEGASGAVTTLETGDYAAAWVMDNDIHARVIPATGDPTPAPGAHFVLADTTNNERLPSVAGVVGSNFLVTHETQVSGSSASLGYGIVAGPGTVLAPEAPALAAILGVSRVRRASVARASNGFWFVWTGGDSDAISAQYLPFD